MSAGLVTPALPSPEALHPPVAVGNIIGGSLLVGGIYWLAYLRPQERTRERPSLGGAE
jgi:hypothetical protein